MAVAPGEYVFDCGECDGKGEIEVLDLNSGEREWVFCPDCRGDKVLRVDEDEAAEMIEGGAWPLSAPADFSDPG